MSAWPSVAKIGKPMQDLGPWVWNTSREVRNAMVTSNHLKPYSPSSTQSTVIRAHDWCKIMSWRIPGGSCTYTAKSWFWRCSSFNRTSGNFCVTPSCSCGPAKPRNVCNNISLSWPGPLPWVVCYMLHAAGHPSVAKPYALGVGFLPCSPKQKQNLPTNHKGHQPID